MIGFLAAMALATAVPLAQADEAQLVFSAEDFETTVYFDYGRLDLGPAGTLLVEAVAERALAVGITEVTVTGHTDRAGSEAKNYEDGLERAQAVAAVLIASGFAEDNVNVESAGETQPVRVYEDERREPLNRRAVITFSE